MSNDMIGQNVPYMFISYAHKDAKKVKPLIAFLEQRGYPIWYYKGEKGHAIPAGQAWTEFVGKKAEKCACLIAVYSKAYFDSPYCFGELTIATNNNCHIIPVFLEDIPEPSKVIMLMGGSCQGLRWCDFDSDGAFFDTLERDAVISSFARRPASETGATGRMSGSKVESPLRTSKPASHSVRKMLRDIFGQSTATASKSSTAASSMHTRKRRETQRGVSAGSAAAMQTATQRSAPPPPEYTRVGPDGRFELRAKIQQGEHAMVYKAYDRVAEKTVALKLYDETTAKASPLLNKPDLRSKWAEPDLPLPALVKVESRLMPPIPCGGIAPKGGSAYIATEFVEGATIAHKLNESSIRGEGIVIYLRDMFGKLEAWHKAGLRLGYISPENVMIDKQLHVHFVGSSGIDVIDAESSFKTMRHTDAYKVEESFFSPEYKAGLKCKHLADVYSMGMMIKYMVIDHSNAIQYFTEQQQSELLKVIEIATQPLPRLRYQSMLELRRALQATLPSILRAHMPFD